VDTAGLKCPPLIDPPNAIDANNPKLIARGAIGARDEFFAVACSMILRKKKVPKNSVMYLIIVNIYNTTIFFYNYI